MNRFERRRARARAPKRDNRLAETVRHWPQVPPEERYLPGTVSHVLYQHDDWCLIFLGEECDCSPIVSVHRQPVTS